MLQQPSPVAARPPYYVGGQASAVVFFPHANPISCASQTTRSPGLSSIFFFTREFDLLYIPRHNTVECASQTYGSQVLSSCFHTPTSCASQTTHSPGLSLIFSFTRERQLLYIAR